VQQSRPEPLGIAFTCAPGRSVEHAVEILQGFGGILQVPSHDLQANHCRAMDGYAGYNRVLDLRDKAPIQLAYCWAHAHSHRNYVSTAGQ